ncbi:MAG: AAA family ATPase [Clostridia bacterium]
MKITRLYVKGYGKIKEREIVFQDGLNLVYGKNETGKSTLLSFIKAMLFGFSTTRSGPDPMLESKKYMPWDGGEYGGTLELEKDDGLSLRIQTDFTSRVSKVYDHTLKDITGQFPYNKREGLKMGETLFEMDRDCFENTAFIRQSRTALLAGEMEAVFEKITNLSQTGMENTSVADARKVLAQAVRQIGNDRTVNRPYNTIREKLSGQERKLKAALEKREQMTGYMELQKKMAPEIEKRKARLEVLRRTRAAKSLFDEKKTIVGQKTRILEMDEDIRMLDESVYHLEKQKLELKDMGRMKEQDILDKIRFVSAASEKEKNLGGREHLKEIESRKKMKRRRRMIAGLSGVVLCLASPFIWGFHVILFAFLLLMGLGLLAWTARDILKDQNDAELLRLKKEHGEYESLMKEKETLNEYFISFGENRIQTFFEAEMKLNKLFEKKRFLDKINQDIEMENKRKNQLEKIRQGILVEAGYKEYKELLTREKTLTAAIKEKGADEAVLDEGEYDRLLEETEGMDKELAGVKALLSEYWSRDEDIVQLTEDMDACRQKLEEMEKEKKALETAAETILQASHLLQEDIIPGLNENMSALLEKITSGVHTGIATSQDKELHADHQNSIKPIHAFSEGTVDQMYFSLRVAASNLFSKKEAIPLLIDEAFAFYDEERTGNTFNILGELAKTRQVILFTCKEKEMKIGKKHGKAHEIIL